MGATAAHVMKDVPALCIVETNLGQTKHNLQKMMQLFGTDWVIESCRMIHTAGAKSRKQEVGNTK